MRVQVVANVLDNAANYTSPCGRIDLLVTCDATSVDVTIRDTGIGVAPPMLGAIFAMFAQAHASLERRRGGLGIGLTLARSTRRTARRHDRRA
jgi:signal transduction histidine kinase